MSIATRVSLRNPFKAGQWSTLEKDLGIGNQKDMARDNIHLGDTHTVGDVHTFPDRIGL